MKLLFLIIILISVSCGKEDSKTNIDFRSTLASTASDFAGGLVLYGKDNSGRSFGRVITGGELLAQVPNGTWSFYLLGWDLPLAGPPNKMSGKVYCAYSSNITLSGGSTDIHFDVSNENCNNPAVFGPVEAYTGPPVEYYFVSNMHYGERTASDLTETPSCLINGGAACFGGVTITGASPMYIGSVNYSIRSFNITSSGKVVDEAGSPYLISECHDLTSQSDASATGLNFPKGGNSSFPFTIAMNLFHETAYSVADGTNSNCSVDSAGFYKKTKLLKHGLLSLQSGVLISSDIDFADDIKFFYRRILP